MKLNKWFISACFGYALYALAQFCEKQTDGFTILRITTKMPYHPEWEISASVTDAIRSLLNQKFTYLGSGGQSYAFLSEDGTTVLKVFKFHRLLKKPRKLQRDFKSYQLAFDQLSNESGLLYVHINQKEERLPLTTIVDKLGISHQLPLDHVSFILQKKANLVYPHIDTLMKSGEKEKGRMAIRSILKLIKTRCQKGIYDEDARIHRNFGFLDNEAILIDVGRLVPDPSRLNPDVCRSDLYKITRRFDEWLKLKHPQLVPVLEEELQRVDHEI